MRFVQHGLAQASVGRPEKPGRAIADVGDDGKTLVHFFSSLGCAYAPGVKVTEGVISDRVAFICDPLKQRRVTLTLRANDEEIRLHLADGQYIQQAWRIDRVRTVVEAQVNVGLKSRSATYYF
jgi:hypothetical protein